ncbi:hypothetical protein J3U01_08575 [Bifidobacterium sp. B4107]|uniref:SDH family Clp fold serine proteinase n=1 Tax=unclassified Bifidobacterium TaxID=2608897 RepID=UPI00226B52AE|nr:MULTISPECIES: hypothetical protein [unclassified Bifidobacterium]MCX8648453.1 hypothetical protein [Bifidobacterium sp. B4107]MCX8652555.1 hypothetical protein [Bifidobacterium sp. B4111]MCX8659081.1 hypothetical protein [Bifidobacterium sp. B4114]
MPSLDELIGEAQKSPTGIIDLRRHEYIGKLAEKRDRNVICYYSGWLQKNDQSRADDISDLDTEGFMANIHGLDKSKGLDLVLHTPGGQLSAVEQLVKYLKSWFNNDIVAFVPQLAMSAGTMMACACKEIYMGKQSAIGPTDPQFGGIPAGGIEREFEQAVKETTKNPSSSAMWAQIISKYTPTLLGECRNAVQASTEMVKDWLSDNMLKDDEQTADHAARWLGTHENSAMHDRHINIDQAREIGLKVIPLEEDNELQDIVLTIHHAYMLSFERSNARKMIENSEGKSWIIQQG